MATSGFCCRTCPATRVISNSRAGCPRSPCGTARSSASTTWPTRRSSLAYRLERHPARVAGGKSLLGDTERAVDAGAHVLQPDLVRELHHALVPEGVHEFGDLFVGHLDRGRGHRVGVGDRQPLIPAVLRRGGV